ncbi:MAG: type II secretion system ATPase GspE [Pseudomonadota bacterium]|nr:type II secretion system ATPase GspE [Pseudomonadota bacterium]
MDQTFETDKVDLKIDASLENQVIEKTPSLSFGFARKHGIIISSAENTENHVHAFVRRGSDPSCISEVRRNIDRRMKFELLSKKQFDEMLRQTYENEGQSAKQMVQGIDDDSDLLQIAQELPEPSDLLEADDDAPIIRLINAILTSAINEGASDIHVEPFENRMIVRFRIDGVMQEVLQSRRAVAPLVVSRIKVMSKLDIAEKRLPQDGRISLRIAGRAVDVRVSTMPASHGERVVMRLLDKQSGRISLEGLGMNAGMQNSIDNLINRPNGIILVTGPTGSGKTTTLYAALERINDDSRNIMTVEDPIEYYFDGIGQSQVNNKVDMTFARGLRAILRQDPDVVMVGEIRDLETAEIAVQASLTGHLVLSTLHTNTAVGAVTRLRDMGIEPFLLASSLIGVISQRLVRVLDSNTRKPYEAPGHECELLNLNPENKTILYRANDLQNGFSGRTGIYEVVEIDNKLRQMIHDGVGEYELESEARNNSDSILQHGIEKVLKGETALEELMRVTRSE